MAQLKLRGTALLERGDIYFLYRPRVGVEEVRGLEDVERVYLVLKPSRARKYRVLIIGHKRLPDAREHDRYWAFVWRVFEDREALREELGERRYVTKTRGERHLAAARPVGEGIYAIVRHGDHTHLAYRLELPKRQGPAERELDIRREASYILSVKNPATPTPPGAGLDPEREARFSPQLQDRFGGKRFIPVDPPDFMDTEGAELVLIGATEDAQTELGIEFVPDDEDEHTADVLKDLKLPPEVAHAPLFEGRWR